MKIIVNSGGKRMVIPVPMFLLPKAIAQSGDLSEMDKEDAKALIKGLKKYVKTHGHFTLVEIQSGDDHVIIRV